MSGRTIEDAVQAFTGHLTLVGVVLTVVGCWFGWPRQFKYQRGEGGVISFSVAQTIVGLVIAFLGLVLLVIGLVSHPLY